MIIKSTIKYYFISLPSLYDSTQKKRTWTLKNVLTFEIAIKNGSDVFIALANQCKWNSLFKQINWFSSRYDQK